ncbi:MAG TPA: hypothetical protein VN950_03225 [Terriglobales bacterium]|nr:hypothetical protein [Terriglobales bacterium]
MFSVTVLYVVAVAVAILGIAFGIAAVSARRSVATIANKVDWVHETLDQAARQISAGDDDEDAVVSGLQKIAQFNAPELRARVFRRIEELRKSSNANIARQAEWTHEAVVRQIILHKSDRDPGITPKK